MIDRTHRAASWPDVLLLLASVALGIALVSWADGEFLKLEPATAESTSHPVSRPEWVWRLHHSYRRIEHDLLWTIVAATLGMGGIVARNRATWSRRGLTRPGTYLVLIVTLFGGVTVIQYLMAGRYISTQGPLSYELRNRLAYQIPDLILGIWTVGWLGKRRRDLPGWRERLARLVGWLWITNVILLIAYGVLFG